ncbi:MAG TPA: permease-like cell division protein FtsX [bacterium]|jgi:cell division transport system permease protein
MISGLAFALQEGTQGARRGVLHSLIAVGTLTLAVVILGFYYGARINLQHAARGLLGQFQFEAFVALSLPEDLHPDLQRRLQALDPRWRITYISRDEAAAKFSREFDPTLFRIFDENPLPASFIITLPPASLQPDSARRIADRILQLDGIEDLVYDQDLLQLLTMGRRQLNTWGFILGVSTLIIALALTYNAVRLKIGRQRTALRLMSLLGATPRALRGIYLVQGVILGGVGGLLGWICLSYLASTLQIQFSPGLRLLQPSFWAMLLVGLVLGILGSTLAAGRYLRPS